MKPYHLLLALSVIVPAHGAALKTMTTLQGPRVYLRDLFDDAGVNADRPLGPGPVPGGRIVVEARQLKAIARQYGVDWQPISSADRAVLEWPGRPLNRDDAIAAVRAALVTRGAAPDCDVAIPGFNPPIIPLVGASRPVVTQLDYDRELGRFTAVLSINSAAMDPIVARISGEVADVISLPVPVMRLAAGAVLGSDDVRKARVRVTSVHADVVRDPNAVIGMQLKRPVPAGVPIAVADLMLPTQIERGDPVRMQLEAGGLAVTAQGVALEAGAIGERIRVRNITSQAVLEAEVIRPGVVRIVPGTMPITSQARGGFAAARGG
jgi:flagella basal body P-ring formation protein FlgA